MRITNLKKDLIIKKAKPTSKRLLTVFLIVGMLYSTYYFLIKRPSLEPKTPVSKASLQIKLNEHLLNLTSLRDIDITDPSTPFKLEGLRSSIDISLEEYKKELTKIKGSENSPRVPDPLFFEENEKEVLKLYDNMHSLSFKALQYDINQDIGILNSEKEDQEITARAENAANALKTLISAEGLSDKTSSHIYSSINCFEQIKNTRFSKKEDLTSKVVDCDSKYDQMRSSLLKDLLANLNSDSAKKLYSSISGLIDQID